MISLPQPRSRRHAARRGPHHQQLLLLASTRWVRGLMRGSPPDAPRAGARELRCKSCYPPRGAAVTHSAAHGAACELRCVQCGCDGTPAHDDGPARALRAAPPMISVLRASCGGVTVSE
eukprot:SAG31_NODE_7323_length_1719_cov_1.064198_2_plen_119_part_00